jgi:hypothetical protein
MSRAEMHMEVLVLIVVLVSFGLSMLALRLVAFLLALPRLLGYLWTLQSYRLRHWRRA